MFLQLALNTQSNVDLSGKKGAEVLSAVADALATTALGTGPVSGWVATGGAEALTAGSLSRACAGVFLASAATDLTTTINGVESVVEVGEDDTETAALAVAAINAETDINNIASASMYFGTMTLATVVAGTRVTVCGYTFTAAASATGLPGEFDVSGTDDEAAAALAAAINATPLLNAKLVAASLADACYVFLAENRAARADETLSASAETVTCAAISTGPAFGVFALQPGALGNCCTITSVPDSGDATVFSAVTNKLGGGTGGFVSGGTYLTSDMK